MEKYTLAFGKRVRDIRISKKISQEKLAELCGLHPTYIGQIERGEKSPTLESICKISIGLETSLCKLFSNMNYENNLKEDYSTLIYNLLLSLPDDKKEKVYHLINQILNF